jgi:hypothetical protein
MELLQSVWRYVTVALLATGLTTSASSAQGGVRASMLACASQAANRPVTSTSEAATIVRGLAAKLNAGSYNSGRTFSPGHTLYCRNDQGNWNHVPAGSVEHVKIEAWRSGIASLMAKVAEAQTAFGLDKDFAAAMRRNKFGTHASLVSIGEFKHPTNGVYSPMANLIGLPASDNLLSRVDTAVHELLGHFSFNLACSVGGRRSCPFDPNGFAKRLITEADAYAKQTVYAVYLRQTIGPIEAAKHLSSSAINAGGVGVSSYFQLAQALIQENSEWSKQLASGRIPREFWVALLERIVGRAPANYFDAGGWAREQFGSDQDIEAAVGAILGSSPQDRKRVLAAFKASPAFKRLRSKDALTPQTISRFLNAPDLN